MVALPAPLGRAHGSWSTLLLLAAALCGGACDSGDAGSAGPGAADADAGQSPGADGTTRADTGATDTAGPADAVADGALPVDTTVQDSGGAADDAGQDAAVDAGVGADASGPNPQVETPSGPVIGARDGGVRSFLGIPFAEPPVGPLRFAPPVAKGAWTEPFDASTFGPACPQGAGLGPVPTDQDEDCLTVNVWTPDPAPDNAPVMLFIHGGGFTIGSGAQPVYDGANLASRGVILVTFNYRLGPLGFAAHAALSAEDPAHPASGNYGIMDQQLAMAWVRDHIAAFGGDPDNVTLFGESAGAVSTCLHLVAPGSAGLFQRVIMESGVCGVTPTLAAAEAQGETLADALGCTGDPAAVLTCLRSAPAADVVSALPAPPGLFFGPGARWGAVDDGVVLDGNPLMALLTGGAQKVPTLVGSNADEGSLFVWLAGGGLTVDDYQTLVAGLLPTKVDAIMAQYPPAAYASVDEAVAQVIGDGLFICPTRLVARLSSSAGTPTWMYQLTRAVPIAAAPGLGAFHSEDLLYVFGNTYLGTNLAGDDLALADAVQGYWTRYAATGDPDGEGAVAWPAYDASTDPYLQLDVPIEAKAAFKADTCDFWDQIYLSL